MEALKAGASPYPLSVATLIKLAEFRSLQTALLFADYCKTQGYELRVEQQDTHTSLYIAEQDVAAVSLLLAEFSQNPAHPRYQAAAWQQSNQVNTGQKLSWRLPLARMPLTLLVLLLVILVYGWQQIDFRGAGFSLMLINTADWWRWLTPVLLHFSLTHLVFNLAWWTLLGAKIEQAHGTGFLLQLTLSSAVVSNGLQLALAGPNFGGLSGVVYALLGYCYLTDKISAQPRYPVSDGLFLFMLLWLALGFFEVLWVNMANWAHLGGLACGLLWALVMTRRQSN